MKTLKKVETGKKVSFVKLNREKGAQEPDHKHGVTRE
jgi:hypothetical protein